ncbi:MAG: hypothetical protein ACJ73N_09110 [Bryobacteraceae bacterium]
MEAAATQSLGGTHTGTNRWLVPFLPSLTDFAFIWPALLLFVMLPGSSVLLSDGDTGWHIRTGEWIWQHKAVPTTDLFSFTKPHEPWFAWEWGWDLIFAGIHHFWGLGGVVFGSVVILCSVSALLFRLIRRYSDRDILALAFTAFAMCGSGLHWLARPHLISWLFVLIFAHVLLSAEQGNAKALFWLPVLTVLWVNLHGAFFIGILMLLTSAAGEMAGALFSAEPFWKTAWVKSKRYLGCALACSVITLINPYTWKLHWHVLHYVRNSRLLDNIMEFQSANFHQLRFFPFECALVLGVGAAFWCAGCRQFSAAIWILLWAHWSLTCARNIPIFLLISAPFSACMTRELLVKISAVKKLQRVGSDAVNISRDFQILDRLPRLHMVSFAALIVVAGGFIWDKPGFEAQFDSKVFPVGALSFIKSAKFSRLFTTDQWADYLVYQLYPAQQTYVDGRSDMFGADFIQRCRNIMNAQQDWEKNLVADGVDAVMLRPDIPVVSALKESKNWKLLFDNGSVVIFQAVSKIQSLNKSIVKSVQVSPVGYDGRKGLGHLPPSTPFRLNLESQERKSS